ncbi:MAG: universal stress protein [Caulobacteraceae bacterium]|nr:universal stress protein [Caulobacteraceae bacterium]
MPFKTILVHADPGPGCNRRVRTAVQVADWFDGAVTGLGAEAFGPLMASGFATVDGAVIEAAQEHISADIVAAEKHFRAMTVGRAGAEWVAHEDYPDRMLALHARGADLIVASRPERGEGPTYAARPAELIMEAGVPVLLTADGDAPFRGDRVVIGWKDTRESRRAVSDALPLLMRAQHVVVATVGGEGEALAGVNEVARRLARHGVDASVEMVAKSKHSIAETLEDTASRHSADLIVIGAYGHSRLREWMLGGVTEDFIAASSKYLLLSR